MNQPSNRPLTMPTFKIDDYPFVCLFIYGCVCTCLILDYLTGNWAYHHLNCNLQTIYEDWQIWRLFLSWMSEKSGLVVLIICINIQTTFINFEIRNGSPVLLNDFWVNSLALNLYALLLQLIWYLLTGQMVNQGTGLLTIWINILYKYCYYNSEVQILIPATNRKIKLGWYPFLILLLVVLLSWEIRWDAILGLTISCIECRFFNGGIILFSEYSYNDKVVFNIIGATQLNSWKKCKQIQYNDLSTAYPIQFYENLDSLTHRSPLEDESQSLNISNQTTTAQNRYFSGKSVTLSNE